MKVVEYLVNRICELGVTDVFGIPGGVVLDLLYEMNHCADISVHLNYNEQMAAYAACGYAQISGKIGVVYTTKGPGFTNVYTAMTEAYGDSLPVMFITAHHQRNFNENIRIEQEQEINHVRMAEPVTKYAVRIDDISEAVEQIEQAIFCLLDRRTGPVLLDFAQEILLMDIIVTKFSLPEQLGCQDDYELFECIKCIRDTINISKQPVILIGDGMRNSGVEKILQKISEKKGIPILSSRVSQDIFSTASTYYGYIGSHGLRYSNYILEKADCLIVLGNRLAFDHKSKTFGRLLNKENIVWIDIDRNEFLRVDFDAHIFCLDVRNVIPRLEMVDLNYENKDWQKKCSMIKEKLTFCDITGSVQLLSKIIENTNSYGGIVCDVGNNELWMSRAYAIKERTVPLLYSKTLKTVGTALGKAIGVYYATRKPALCIMGDEGVQYNIQELQFISQNNLPICIVIWNNESLGMLKDNQSRKGYSYFLHTTLSSGYGNPDFSKIAGAYNISYVKVENKDCGNPIKPEKLPMIIEIMVDETKDKLPYLPKGNKCYDFIPSLDEELATWLNTI